MGITVKDAVGLLELDGIKVGKIIAGFGGIDNIINSVSVIEIPDATAWYRGNELQITAFYSIKGDVQAQVQAVEIIARCGCAALVLCHTGIFLKEISPELIEAANYNNLPLIVVPAELAYIDIITPVLEAIINKQNKELEYTLSIQKRLNQLVLERKNINELSNIISTILKCPLLILGNDNEIVGRSSYGLKDPQLFNTVINDQALFKAITDLSHNCNNTYEIQDYKLNVYSLSSGDKYLGRLLLFLNRVLEPLESIAVNESCNALKLTLIQKLSRQEEILRAQREFIDELLSGSIDKEDMASLRAEYFNLEIPSPSMVMIIELGGYDYYKNVAQNNGKMITQKQQIFVNIVRDIMEKERCESMLLTRGNVLITIFSAAANTYLEIYSKSKKIGALIYEKLQHQDSGLNFFIAIGRQYNRLTEINKSFSEALQALNIGRVVYNNKYMVHVDDLGLFNYLPDLLSNKKVGDLVINAVDILSAYDREKNVNLLETFELLLDEDEIGKAAKKLFVHRNTLINRKNKIKQLLGRDPFQYPEKLNYQLVLFLNRFKKAKDIKL